MDHMDEFGAAKSELSSLAAEGKISYTEDIQVHRYCPTAALALLMSHTLSHTLSVFSIIIIIIIDHQQHSSSSLCYVCAVSPCFYLACVCVCVCQDGLENYPKVVRMLLSGDNTGKLILKV